MPLWDIYFSPTSALPDLPSPVQMFLWKLTQFPLLVSLFYLSYSKTLYTLHYCSLFHGPVAIYDSSLPLCSDSGPGEHLWAKAVFVLNWEQGCQTWGSLCKFVSSSSGQRVSMLSGHHQVPAISYLILKSGLGKEAFLYIFACHCCSVAKLCPILCHPMDCSTPGFPVLHYLLELAQSHVRCIGYAI